MSLLKTAEELSVSIRDAINSRNIVLLSNVLLSVGVFCLGVKVLFSSAGVIALPNAPLTEEISVKGSWANEGFKKLHAQAFSELLGNINPNNVRFVKERFLASATPYIQQQFSEELDRQVAIIRARKMDQKFIMEDSYYDEYQDVVWVWGSREITLPNQTPLKEVWTYEWRIGVNAGMPKISYFSQYKGKPNTRQQKVVPADEVPQLSDDMKEGLVESGSTPKGA